MRKTTQDREDIARTRILRVLKNHGVANIRTLEQKISDAGPYDQRIDPHILSRVCTTLVRENKIIKIKPKAGSINWFHHAATPAATVKARLAELIEIHNAFSAPSLTQRIGQSLEIATFRALCLLPNADFFGRFRDLEEHGDEELYSKEEPPSHIGQRYLPGKKKLDFILRSPGDNLGIECKNIRQWLYPNKPDVWEMLRKCLALDCIPVLIGRRIHFVTSILLRSCGVIIHQTFNQLLPESAQDVADKAKNKLLLGYHDIRTGNMPDQRLITFITENLMPLVPDARSKYDRFRDLLEDFASGAMPFEEFNVRVRRRTLGQSEEDLDFPHEEPDDWPDDW